MVRMRYRFWVLITCALFIVGIGAGIIVSAATPESIVEYFYEEMITLGELVDTYGPFEIGTVIFIYFKNVLTLVLSFMFSPILCLMPLIVLIFNGSLIAFISALVLQKESLDFLLLGILPHGIFEIPAFIIGEAAALSFGATAIYALLSKKGGNILLPVFKKNLIYLLVAIILLIPAAIIETYVTPLFLQ
jgi:stage II sporulation protein M